MYCRLIILTLTYTLHWAEFSVPNLNNFPSAQKINVNFNPVVVCTTIAQCKTLQCFPILNFECPRHLLALPILNFESFVKTFCTIYSIYCLSHEAVSLVFADV